MSAADRLLSRLERVKRTGDGRWMARCSAHDDRTPSLSVRECSDGRVLLHCFAGCETEAILASIGLDWPDLFAQDGRSNRLDRPLIPRGHAAMILEEETLLLKVIAHRIASGESPETFREDKQLAEKRIAVTRALLAGGAP